MVELLIKGQTWGGEVNGGEESKIRQTSNKLRESKDVKQRFVVILKEKVEIPYSEGEERETTEDVWGLRRKEERAGEKKKKEMVESCQWAIGGSVSPADIVSMLLTSKGSDYEESEGLQTMGGEENNIKVSRAFELG